MTEPDTAAVAEIDYSFEYFEDLSPALMRFVALTRGVGLNPKPLRYLELGFGQGLSLNVHAASCGGAFWGNDYNPRQVAEAQKLADASGADLTMSAESFAELARREDTPDFDVIALHGIWTWVSEENRALIVDIARRKLAPGGALYLSYNGLSGWAAMAPVQRLIRAYGNAAGANGAPLTETVRAGMSFANAVSNAGSRFFRDNPIVTQYLRDLSGANSAYLAHEFFSDAWTPMAFPDVANRLSVAGLSYVGSTFVLDGVERLTLSAAGRQLLEGVSDRVLRESAKEMLLGMSFRKDVFVKEPNLLSDHERDEKLLGQHFILVGSPQEAPSEVHGPAGPLKVDAALFRPILDALADNAGRAKSLADLRQRGVFGAKTVMESAEDLMALMTTSLVRAVHEVEPSITARKRCRELNRYICERASAGTAMHVVASPVLGAGLTLDIVDQLFLLGAMQGRDAPRSLANFAKPKLTALGHPEAGAAIEEMTRWAEDFLEHWLPMLRRLAVL